MSFFHQHNFIEIERFYAEPSEDWIKACSITPSKKGTFAKYVFGQTTILYKCANKIKFGFPGVAPNEIIFRGCGKTRTEVILGRSLKNETNL